MPPKMIGSQENTSVTDQDCVVCRFLAAATEQHCWFYFVTMQSAVLFVGIILM